MNKRSHLMITEELVMGVCRRHRFCLRAGCILPDFFVKSLLKGHTWNITHEKIHDKMLELGKNGQLTMFSFLKLGYILHYVEDYFTFPHNAWYTGSVKEHIQYERDLEEYIRTRKTALPLKAPGHFMSPESLFQFLRQTHDRYTRQKPCFENDLYYMTNTAYDIAQNYLIIFRKHSDSMYAKKAAFPEPMTSNISTTSIQT